jgi:hypothetical protein
MASVAFERFRFSFFEDPNSPRDGLDTTAVSQLAGEERDRAEDMLIRSLPDSRAVIGLGVLRSRRAEFPLVVLFEAERSNQLAAKHIPGRFWSTDALVYVAKALWQIRADPRWLAAMTDVLASGSDWTQRQTAAEALCDVNDPAVVRALIAALDDPEPLVRYHAARGLLMLHGLPAAPRDPEHMMYRLMSDNAARRAVGKHDILAAISAHPSSRP